MEGIVKGGTLFWGRKRAMVQVVDGFRYLTHRSHIGLTLVTVMV